MSYDQDKVDEATLSLLLLTLHDIAGDGSGRAWKGFDWDTLDRLHRRGLISNPASRSKSVTLSAEAVRRGRAAFERMFGGSPGSAEASIDLLNTAAAVPVDEATGKISTNPGLYAVWIDDAANLPEYWRMVLEGRGTRLLYVGSATVSLFQRVIEQDLRHRKASTFFRSLGAVLGYRPPRGSMFGARNKYNYRFSPDDTLAIQKWARAHLHIAWKNAPTKNLVTVEADIIRATAPVFNDKHNPFPNPRLQELREACRRIACGDER